jgi:hypothetical protein
MVVSSKLREQHSVERFFDVDALPEPDEIGRLAFVVHGTGRAVLGNISLMIWVKLTCPMKLVACTSLASVPHTAVIV